jgi:hypothetical protein
MPHGDEKWIRRNPDRFAVMGGDRERLCECGEALVRDGKYWATQDHPWRPPKVECDCGMIQQIVGLRVRDDPKPPAE